MSPTQTMSESTPTPPASVPDALPPSNAPASSANGDDETALERLADDGGPPPVQSEVEVPGAPSPSESLSGAPPVPAHTLSLEERVRRLEDAVMSLQERRPKAEEDEFVVLGLEEALTTLQEQRDQEPHPATPAAASPPDSTGVLLDAGKRLLGVAAQVIPPALASVPSIAHPTNRGTVQWLLWETWAEARAIVRMFVDRRYHRSWSARVLPLVLLAAILVPKQYWIPGAQIPVLGDWLLSKAINLLLAFLLFKWLGHEARRYRQTSPDLPSSLRL